MFVYFDSQLKICFLQIKTNKKFCEINSGLVDSVLGVCCDEHVYGSKMNLESMHIFLIPVLKMFIIIEIKFTHSIHPFVSFFNMFDKVWISWKLISLLAFYFPKFIWISCKGQLISKCPFGVFKSSKKPMNLFLGFLTEPLKRGQIKK